MENIMALTPVKEETCDKVIEFRKNVIETFIPGGVPAVKILESLFGVPILKRRETLMQDICDAINMILHKGFTLEQLQHDENFMEFLFRSIRIAGMSLKNDKRSALKNAIVNAATHSNPPTFEMQQIFLSYIETFTVTHLKLLHFLVNPQAYFTKYGHESPKSEIAKRAFTVRDAIIMAYPELESAQGLVNIIWTDLYSKDLLEVDKHILDERGTLPRYRNKLDTLLPSRNVLECQVTPLGIQFVDFISEN